MAKELFGLAIFCDRMRGSHPVKFELNFHVNFMIFQAIGTLGIIKELNFCNIFNSRWWSFRKNAAWLPATWECSGKMFSLIENHELIVQKQFQYKNRTGRSRIITRSITKHGDIKSIMPQDGNWINECFSIGRNLTLVENKRRIWLRVESKCVWS